MTKVEIHKILAESLKVRAGEDGERDVEQMLTIAGEIGSNQRKRSSRFRNVWKANKSRLVP